MTPILKKDKHLWSRQEITLSNKMAETQPITQTSIEAEKAVFQAMTAGTETGTGTQPRSMGSIMGPKLGRPSFK